jgi:hypothetical protein
MSHECFGCICRQSIKHYFLLDQGDFLVYFMDSSSAAHCSCSNRKSRLWLRRCGAIARLCCVSMFGSSLLFSCGGRARSASTVAE